MAHEPAESGEWVCSLCARPKHERYILEKNESFEISILDPESHTTIMTWALKELEAKAARAAAAEAERDALKIAMNVACRAMQRLAPLGSDPVSQDTINDCLEIMHRTTDGIRKGDFSVKQFQPILQHYNLLFHGGQSND